MNAPEDQLSDATSRITDKRLKAAMESISNDEGHRRSRRWNINWGRSSRLHKLRSPYDVHIAAVNDVAFLEPHRI